MSRRHTYSSVLSHRTGNGWAILSMPAKCDNKSGKCVTLTHDVGLCEEWQQASRGTQAICCVSNLFQGYADHSASGKSALIRVVMHGWNLADDFRLCSHRGDDELQAVSATHSPVRPGACARVCTVTPICLHHYYARVGGWQRWPSLPLWNLLLCVSAYVHVWLCAFSHLQTGPPTAEGSLLAAKWRTSLNKHPVASTLPLLFIMGGEGSLQSMAFSPL